MTQKNHHEQQEMQKQMPQSSFTILSNMMGASLLSGAYII